MSANIELLGSPHKNRRAFRCKIYEVDVFCLARSFVDSSGECLKNGLHGVNAGGEVLERSMILKSVGDAPSVQCIECPSTRFN